jgi:ribokinase
MGWINCYPYASVIIVNEGEYEAYKEILSSFTGLLAVTKGAEGAVLFENKITVASIKPPHMKPIDTSGAGDCFAAALSLCLMEGKPYGEALAFACAAGALVTQKIGTQPAMPNRLEIEKLSSAF